LISASFKKGTNQVQIDNQEKVIVFGAGLVGTLLAIFLAKRGYQVDVYEKRRDILFWGNQASRSINLALSDRGWSALKALGIEREIEKVSLPIIGRMMHDLDGELTGQLYGKEGQCIYSVSRYDLNNTLVSIARKYPNITFHFEHRCLGINFSKNQATVMSIEKDETFSVQADYIFGSDGAFSAIRQSMQKNDLFNYEQFYIPHGYKEFHIDARKDGDFAMPSDRLHIWPRGTFMMMALPNPDRTFTATLFFPFKGELSFDTLNSPEAVYLLFEDYFPDLVQLMPDYQQQFFANPTSSLVTIKCYPWVMGNTVLIGDAAHAIVPFFGQGMNSGFEDCLVLDRLIDEFGSLESALPVFEKSRKPSADAIAELALQNFIEMRDHVADPNFLLRKQIEAKFHKLYPNDWIPLYSMVTFSDMPYEQALARGKKQEKVMQRIMRLPDLSHRELNDRFIRQLWIDYVVEPASKL
jgi:kynurenine 3-monooxygenase